MHKTISSIFDIIDVENTQIVPQAIYENNAWKSCRGKRDHFWERSSCQSSDPVWAHLRILFPAKLTLPVGTSAHSFDRQRLRHWRAPHDCQLHTEAHFQSSNVLLRSLVGLVFCYNKLPQHVAAAKSVKKFQRHLQYGLMKGANSGMPNWQLLYSGLWKQMPVTRFDALFG